MPGPFCRLWVRACWGRYALTVASCLDLPVGHDVSIFPTRSRLLMPEAAVEPQPRARARRKRARRALPLVAGDRRLVDFGQRRRRAVRRVKKRGHSAPPTHKVRGKLAEISQETSHKRRRAIDREKNHVAQYPRFARILSYTCTRDCL